MAAIPLIRHCGPASIFAYRGGDAVTAARFIGDVRELARQLPERAYMLNLCTDRYRFAVGFSAALLRRQVSLLPPNYTHDFVERLSAAYPGTYCLTDGATNFPSMEAMAFPTLSGEEDALVPSIPATQLAALVFTSGSTGSPVPHEKTWGGLAEDGIAEALALGVQDCPGMAVLGTVPSQHMYGLESTMLIAMQNGLALVAERPFYPKDICAQLDALPSPRCLVTTPVHLRTLLAEITELPAVSFVLCATAPLSLGLAEEAEERFGVPLYEIYGCTEAGQLASRRPTAGTAWWLMRGISMRQDERGTWVKGGHVEIEAQLSDVIELNGDGSFFLHGRLADLVNIAGKRTSLASLNHHLTSIPGVRDGVFVMPDDADADMARAMAFVVAPGLTSEVVMKALRNCIDPVFLPRPLYFVDALPRSATGKLTRDALQQLVREHASRR